ncbi:MAG TPA: methionyl-tRNA formyltransferase [bacterium]|nr:methionyl-tRNA formyltransferase [bacterium]
MSSPKPQIIFFGTSDFAANILKSLATNSLADLILVVTQPDQPTGRHQTLTPPPVKILAQKLGLSIIQPANLDDTNEIKLKDLQADLFIIAAYGLIIPSSILTLPRLGCLNIHPSLLPLYRGPSPIQTCLLNGDQETGISLILLDKKMDHGPLVSQIKIPVEPTDNYLTLSAKLADHSSRLLISTLPKFITNEIRPQAQNHSAATFTKIIKKINGQINWQNNAQKIYNQWRAFYLWPNIFSVIKIKNKNILIKFNEIKPTSQKPISQNDPGTLFVDSKKLLAACGESSCLEILRLQPEGKKIMTADEFINGYLK